MGDVCLLSAGEEVTRAPAVLVRVTIPGLNPRKLARFRKPANGVPRRKGLGPHTTPFLVGDPPPGHSRVLGK